MLPFCNSSSDTYWQTYFFAHASCSPDLLAIIP